jgi:hypothetical protein
MDSRSLKDSNGISFVIFGLINRKIWFFKDLDQFWLEKPIWILFRSKAGHVAQSYSLIPFRADKDCDPSDLMRSERLRFTRTHSLKWIDLRRWIGIRRSRSSRGGGAHRRARVPSPAMRSGTGIGWWRASGDPRRWGIRGQRADEDGELDCLNGCDDFLLWRRRTATGGSVGFGRRWSASSAMK